MPKRYLTGGGKDLKNHSKSIYYFSIILKNLKYFTKKLARFLRPRNEEELSRGVVLIEFAICMPILIILLFYINDLVKIKRYYAQTEFVAQQVANIIQNISQNRTDKRITISDMKRAGVLAYHSVYPGQTMFYDGLGYGYELSHRPYIMIFYAKGESGGKASVKWIKRVWNYKDKAPTMRCDTINPNYGLKR